MLQVKTLRLVLLRLWRNLPPGWSKVQAWQRSLLKKTVAFLATLAGAAAFRQRRLQMLHDSAVQQELRAIEDPTFGPGIVHDMDHPDRLHEAFLDAVQLKSNSPIHDHLCQLFRRPGVDEQLSRLYDQASAGASRISREAFMSLSRGIHGHLHQLLNGQERMALAACTPEDQKWIFNHFDSFFPLERPLDRRLFVGYFKLILMRRIVRTLVAHVGLSKLRRGTSAPLVLFVGVDLGGDQPPFRLNTVTPNAKTVLCGESLTLIEEMPGEMEVPLPSRTNFLLPGLLQSLRFLSWKP